MDAALDLWRNNRPLIGLAALGSAIIAICAVMLQVLVRGDYEYFVIAALIHGVVYALAVWLVLRSVSFRFAWVFVVFVAIIARAIILLAPPILSDDIYRYIWDGRVQAAGVNPYQYIPADDRLAPQRDGQIYPNINRKDYARTIYPPAAQIIFLSISRISETVTAVKFAMFGFEVVTIVAIMALLRQANQTLGRVVIYAWHPLPMWEFSGAGHIDAAAIAFMCLAMLAAFSDRRVIAGMLLAAGALVKPFPLIVAPTLWKKWDWRMPVAFVVTAVVLYLPYLGVGWRVLGFLGGYGDEEGYLDGKGFFLVAFLRVLGLPSPSGFVFAVLTIGILLVLALIIVSCWSRHEIEMTAPILLGSVFLLLASPHYAWYFAWVLPFRCRFVFVPLLYLTLAAFVFYVPEIMFSGNHYWAGLLLYGGFTIVLIADLIARGKQLPIGRIK